MHEQAGNRVQIARAVVWEFWALGWGTILLSLLGGLLFPALLYGAISWESDVPMRGTTGGALMQFGFYWVTLLFIGVAVLSALGKSQQRYVLPASSFLLVTCLMACAMITTFLMYVVIALSLNALFDAGWSIWAGGLLAAVMVAWAQAILWSTSNSQGLQLTVCVASALPWLAVVAWMSPRPRDTAAFLEHFSTAALLLLAAGSCACVGVGTLGFDCLRHGSGLDMRRIVDWFSRLWPTLTHSASYSSPAAAQFWLEWTRRGWGLPFVTALVALLPLVLAWCAGPGGKPGGIASLISLYPVGLSCIFGLVLGLRSDQGEFSSFEGTRPLSDAQLARAVLKSATLGIMTSALIWAVAAALALWIGGPYVETPVLRRFFQKGPLPCAAVCLLGVVATWSASGLITSLALAGKRVLMLVLWIAGFLLALFIVGSRRWVSPETHLLLVRAYLDSAVIISLIVSLATFIVGWRLQLIGGRTLCLAMSIVTAAGMLAYLAGLFDGIILSPGLSLPLLAICIGCLLPLPLAAAPLAVWTNRHR